MAAPAITKYHIRVERDRIRVGDNSLSQINCLHMIGHDQHLAV